MNKNSVSIYTFLLGVVFFLFVLKKPLLAQVKIGDNPLSISPHAILELESINKGVIFPRVRLTSTVDNITLGPHTMGMIVYNKSIVPGPNAVQPGLYYNNGSQWRLISSGSSLSSRIGFGDVLRNNNNANGLNFSSVDTGGLNYIQFGTTQALGSLAREGLFTYNPLDSFMYYRRSGRWVRLAIDNASSFGYIPALRSSREQGFIVTTNSQFGGLYEAYTVFDEINSDPVTDEHSWTTGNNVMPKWVQIELDKSIAISRYQLKAITKTTLTSETPTNWLLLASNNGSTFDTLDTQLGQVFNPGEQKFYPITSSASYKYYRLYVTRLRGGASPPNFLRLDAFQLYRKTVGLNISDVLKNGNNARNEAILGVSSLGIGTTSPTEVLDVSGGVRFRSLSSRSNSFGPSDSILITNPSGVLKVVPVTAFLNRSPSGSNQDSQSLGLSQSGDSLLINRGRGVALSLIDRQTLSVTGNILNISNGNGVVLPSSVNTDNQSLTLNGSDLSISGGNTITLPTAAGSNNQDLSRRNDSLLISGGDGVRLSEINTDSQRLRLSGNNLSIGGGNTISIPSNTDNQNLNLSGSNLSITGGNTITLPSNTDNQSLTLNGSDLSISGGNTITLPTASGSNNQDLSRRNDSLLISGGDGVRLSEINTDSQRLRLSGNNLSIGGGNTISIPSNTDNQSLTLNGSDLSISGGNTITLPTSAGSNNQDLSRRNDSLLISGGDGVRLSEINTDSQRLRLNGNNLSIGGGNTISIPSNTDNQSLTLNGSDLSISGGNTITLPTAAGSNNQDLSRRNDSLLISGGDGVRLSEINTDSQRLRLNGNNLSIGGGNTISIPSNTDNQNLTLSGSDLSISGGNTITLPTAAGSNNQDLSRRNDSLLISGGDGVRLSEINTDSQRLRLNGNNLSIGGGNTISIPSNTDNQSLTLSGSDLSISGGNTITLPTAAGSNNQDLSRRNDSLLISGGDGVRLSEINTDSQRLRLNGNNLSIGGGNTISIPSNTDNQNLNLSGSNLSITGGNTITLPSNTDNQSLTLSGSDLSISGGNTITLPTAAGSNNQDLSINNDSLLISGGSGLKLSDISTDTQRLSISGSDLSISGGNTITLPTATGGSDSQDLGKLNDSILTISSGDSVALSEFLYLPGNNNTYGENPDVNKGYSATQGTGTAVAAGDAKRGWATSSQAQPIKDFLKYFDITDAQVTEITNNINSAEIKFHVRDRRLSQSARIASTGYISFTSLNNSEIISTLNGADFKFRASYDVGLKTIKIEDNHFKEATYTNNYGSVYGVSVRVSTGLLLTNTGSRLKGLVNENTLSISGSDLSISGGNTITLPTSAGSSNQDLSRRNDSLLISGGDGVRLSEINTDSQRLRLNGNNLSIGGGNTISIPSNTDNQNLTLSGSDLSISGGNTITLPTAAGSNNQDLSRRNDSLLISGGDGVRLSEINTDSQRLRLNGNNLSIGGGNTISIPSNTDNQNLNLSGSNLSITGGNTITLPSNTDNQSLTLSGSDLSISGGNTITLPTAAGSNNQDLSRRNDSLLISGGDGVRLSEINTDSQRLRLSGNNLSIGGGNTISIPSNTDNQNLNLSGSNLSITGGNTITLPSNTDNQSLTLNGSDLSISGGNTITLPTATGGSDSQDLGKLNDSILTISSGDSVALSEFLYLPGNNNTYGENPDVNKGYSATQGTGTAVAAGTAKRGWATSSQAQPIKDFLKYFDITDAQVTEITNNINSAQIRFYLRDRRANVNRTGNTGYISFTSLNNSEIISTLGGFDFKFRASYDVGLKTIKIEDNHFKEATYTNNYGSVYGLSVRVSTGLLLTNTGSRLKGLVNENTLSISGSDLSISGGNTITLPTSGGSSNQDLSRRNDSLLISGGDGVRLSEINTDSQRLRLSGNNLSIGGGNTISIPLNTDTQKLSIVGSELRISGGNSVTLPSSSSGGGKFVDGSNTNDAVYTSGRVGIGTSAPTARLEVDGSVRLKNLPTSPTTDTVEILFTDTTGRLLKANSISNIIKINGTIYQSGRRNISYTPKYVTTRVYEIEPDDYCVIFPNDIVGTPRSYDLIMPDPALNVGREILIGNFATNGSISFRKRVGGSIVSAQNNYVKGTVNTSVGPGSLIKIISVNGAWRGIGGY